MHGQSKVSRIRTGLLAVPRVRLEGASGLFRLLGSWAESDCDALSAPSRHRRGVNRERQRIQA
jgi:hypothetical protein